MRTLIALLLLFFTPYLKSALPPEAQAYLDKIPEKKLTLPFIIKVSLTTAQGYRMIGYDYATAGLERMASVESMTDTFFTMDGGYSDDNSAKTTAFQPLRTKQWKWGVGLGKQWSSGTLTKVGWEHDQNEVEAGGLSGPSIPGFSISNFFIPFYKQSALTVGFEQSLLKNSFGYALRRKEDAAKARGAGIQWRARNDLEKLTLDFINQYYQSWLMQQQVKSLTAQAGRQKRLVRVLTDRSKKGAVEKPDLIQMETLLSATNTGLSQARYTLANQWEALAISLDFPETFLKVDPMDIPIDIDNPVPLSLRVCGQKEPIKTAEIVALEKSLEGLREDFKAAKNESLPDLKLVAGYRGNSIDSSASTTVENVWRGRDDEGFGRGPAWNVGLKLNWPLNNSAAKAQRTDKYIKRERVASQLEMVVDNLKILWRDSCRRLQVEFDNEKVFENVVAEQKKRVRAEERRFRLGRIGVDQLVTAENDLGDWEFKSQQKAVQVRLLAWQVQKYSGDMYRFLAPSVEALLNGEKN